MKNKLLIIIILAFVIRLLLLLTHQTIGIDGTYYTKLGENLISGKGYVDIEGITNIILPPLYPILIGIGSLLVIPTYFLCKKFYHEKTAYVAALFIAVYPVLSYISGIVYSESTYLFFLTLGMLFGWLALDKKKYYLYFICGLIFGLSYLTRAEGFVYLGVIILFSLPKIKRNWFNILSLLIGFLLIASPYLLFLHKETGNWMISGQSNPDFLIKGATIIGAEDVSKYEKAYESVYYGAPKGKIQSFLGYVLSNPKSFISNYIKNVYHTFTYNIPLLFPIFFLLFVGLGLFKTPWSTVRLKKELFLICFFLIPLIIYPITITSPRMFVSLTIILLIWAAKGCIELESWSNKLRNIAIIFVIVLCLLGNAAAGLGAINISDTNFSNEKTELIEYKQAGLWLKENAEPTPIIMARKVRIAFYANGLYVRLPYTDYEGILKKACKSKVDYLIIDKASTEKLRPNLIFLLNERNTPDNLKFIHKIGDEIFIYKPIC